MPVSSQSVQSHSTMPSRHSGSPENTTNSTSVIITKWTPLSYTIWKIRTKNVNIPKYVLLYTRGFAASHVQQSCLQCNRSRRVVVMTVYKKGKGSPYSITERRVPELIPVFGSQPAGDASHKPGGKLPLLSARPAVTPTTLKRAATNFAAW